MKIFLRTESFNSKHGFGIRDGIWKWFGISEKWFLEDINVLFNMGYIGHVHHGFNLLRLHFQTLMTMLTGYNLSNNECAYVFFKRTNKRLVWRLVHNILVSWEVQSTFIKKFKLIKNKHTEL